MGCGASTAVPESAAASRPAAVPAPPPSSAGPGSAAPAAASGARKAVLRVDPGSRGVLPPWLAQSAAEGQSGEVAGTARAASGASASTSNAAAEVVRVNLLEVGAARTSSGVPCQRRTASGGSDQRSCSACAAATSMASCLHESAKREAGQADGRGPVCIAPHAPSRRPPLPLVGHTLASSLPLAPQFRLQIKSILQRLTSVNGTPTIGLAEATELLCKHLQVSTVR